MGASVALMTPPRPEVVAIIVDSPFARSDDIIQRIICYQLTQASNGWIPVLQQLRHLVPAVAWATIAASTIVFRVRFGYAMVARPDISLRRWRAINQKEKTAPPQHSIPILLIHSSEDELIPIAHARQLAAEAKAYDIPMETYFIDGAPHCGGYAQDPQGYQTVMLNFLANVLGEDLPPQHYHLIMEQ